MALTKSWSFFQLSYQNARILWTVEQSPTNQSKEKYVYKYVEYLKTHIWWYTIDADYRLYIYKLAWTTRITPCFGRPARLKRKRSWNGRMHRSFQIFSFEGRDGQQTIQKVS